MNTKFLNWIVLIGLMMGMLVGCAQDSGDVGEDKPEQTESGNEEKPSAGVRTLTLMGDQRNYEGEEEAWAEVIGDFEKEFNVNVDYRFQGEWHEVPQMLETAKIAGEPIDVAIAGAGLINTTLVRAKLVKDLTEFIEPFENRFTQGSFIPFTVNNRIWGMPYDTAATTTVIYNKTIFDELGLDEPATYEELVEISRIISEEKGIMPMIQDGKSVWMWPIWYFETYAQASENNSIKQVEEFLSGKRQFTGEEEQLAFELIAQFYKDGLLTQESLDTDTDARYAIFAQGKAAMLYAGTWAIPPLREAVGDDIELGIFEFPIVVEGSFSQHGGGATKCFIIPSFANPENYDLSRQFLEFITREENATKILSKRRPLGPTIASVPLVEGEPLANELFEEIFPNTITFLDWIWPMEINDAFTAGIPAVVTGAITPAEAAQNVQAAFDAMAEEKNYKFDYWTDWTNADWEKVTIKNPPAIYVDPEDGVK